jgi:hypothetical protein
MIRRGGSPTGMTIYGEPACRRAGSIWPKTIRNKQMKKIFILCLVLSFAGKIFSQAGTTIPNASVKADYLKKSKTQKTVAWVLLGSGTTMIISGVIVGRNSVEDPDINKAFNGGALILGGILVDIISIPFFIASAKNKGRSLSVSFKNELVPRVRQSSLVQAPLPSVSLVIRL